jgi:aspartate kinase
MIVMKFGGSSVADRAQIEKVLGIVRAHANHAPLVVCSAHKGVTDGLVKAAREAAKGRLEVETVIAKQLGVARELGCDDALLAPLFDDLRSLLRGVQLVRELSARSLDYVSSFGERWSTRVIADFFSRSGLPADAHDVWDLGFVTDASFGHARPVPGYEQQMRDAVARLPAGRVPIVTGFIGKTADGEITTVGRNGSDLTATLVGAALGAAEVQIWSDTDGVMTADPRLVRSARNIPDMRFDEAAELAYFGSRMLHPATLLPAMAAKIPVRVLNTNRPEHAGTVIRGEAAPNPSPVTSIAYKERQLVLTLCSTRMFGEVGFLGRVFETCARHGVEVDMVTTSEVTVSLTANESPEPRARRRRARRSRQRPNRRGPQHPRDRGPAPGRAPRPRRRGVRRHRRGRRQRRDDQPRLRRHQPVAGRARCRRLTHGGGAAPRALRGGSRVKSLYTSEGAAQALDRYGAAHGEDLALRVYTSRLIGAEPDLVLHGGGNTSVKGVRRTLLGDEVECLWVKGSGASLDKVEPRDFPALDLAYLRRLRGLEALSDEEMVNQLRTHLFDASSPNPSVEALLHALLPHKFVDHSHADAVLAVTNQPDGAKLVREALGDEVALLPYIMPGFPLAKAVADVFERSPRVIGVVLLHHGLFTFGETAKQSYERHIELVDRLEAFARGRAQRRVVSAGVSHAEARARAAKIAPLLRGFLAERAGGAVSRRFVLEWRGGEEVLEHLASPACAELAASGPITPDHVIRTKAWPLFVGELPFGDDAALTARLRDGVEGYRARYDAYFASNMASKRAPAHQARQRAARRARAGRRGARVGRDQEGRSHRRRPRGAYAAHEGDRRGDRGVPLAVGRGPLRHGVLEPRAGQAGQGLGARPRGAGRARDRGGPARSGSGSGTPAARRARTSSSSTGTSRPRAPPPAASRRSTAPGPRPGPSPKPGIASSPKGTTHEFWKSVHAGAVKASRELGRRDRVERPAQGGRPQAADRRGAELHRAGRVRHRARAAQRQGPGASREGASNAKIPVVIFDSDLQGEDHVSFVATDNVAAGKLGGEHLAKLLGGKGKVVVLRYQEGSASTQNREQGFLEA